MGTPGLCGSYPQTVAAECALGQRYGVGVVCLPEFTGQKLGTWGGTAGRGFEASNSGGAQVSGEQALETEPGICHETLLGFCHT